MNKVLITGGAGFIGFHLALEWAKNGAEVDLLDNFSRGKLDSDLEALISYPNINLLSGDLLTCDLPCKNYDYIYHLAAIIGVKNVLGRPYEVLQKNVELTLRVIDIAKEQTQLKRLLFASTSEAYAGTLKHFTMQIPTPETTPLAATDLVNPRTSYMLSKIYGEALCMHSGVPYTIFRPHNIYGPRMGMAHVIPELLKKAYSASQNDSLPVFSPTHTRTFCYVSDAVSMLMAMAIEPKCNGEILNLGQQEPEISIKDLASIILKILKKPLLITEMEDTLGSPVRRCPDMTKTRNLLKNIQNTPLDEGIEKTYKWYKNTFDSEERP